MHISHFVITAIIFSVLSAPAFAKSKKISICHNGQVISVSTKSLNAHANHGDTIGDECPIAPEPEPESEQNAVFILHCESGKVSYMDSSGLSDLIYDEDDIVLGDSCADSVSKTMDDEFNLRNVEGVNGHTEYLFIMKY